MHSLTLFFCKLQNVATPKNSFLQSVLDTQDHQRELVLAEIIKRRPCDHSCELGETIELFAKNLCRT